MTDGINRKALIFILATIIIDMIGLGIIVPVAPRIIMDLTHQGYAAAAEYSGWLTGSFAAMLFLRFPRSSEISRIASGGARLAGFNVGTGLRLPHHRSRTHHRLVIRRPHPVGHGWHQLHDRECLYC